MTNPRYNSSFVRPSQGTSSGSLMMTTSGDDCFGVVRRCRGSTGACSSATSSLCRAKRDRCVSLTCETITALCSVALTPQALDQNQQTLEGAKRIVAEGVRVTENEEEAKLVPHLSLSPTPTFLITTRTDHSVSHTGHDATQSRQDADQGHDVSQTRINPHQEGGTLTGPPFKYWLANLCAKFPSPETTLVTNGRCRTLL
jgi:hypothetical protein